MVASVVNAEIVGQSGTAEWLSRYNDDGIAGVGPSLIENELVHFFDEACCEFRSLQKARPDAKHDGHAAESSRILTKGYDRNCEAQLR